MIYESRPKARVARKVWDSLLEHTKAAGAELKEMWYNGPNRQEYGDRWMYVAKRNDPGSLNNTLEGWIHSDLTNFFGEWTSARTDWWI